MTNSVFSKTAQSGSSEKATRCYEHIHRQKSCKKILNHMEIKNIYMTNMLQVIDQLIDVIHLIQVDIWPFLNQNESINLTFFLYSSGWVLYKTALEEKNTSFLYILHLHPFMVCLYNLPPSL